MSQTIAVWIDKSTEASEFWPVFVPSDLFFITSFNYPIWFARYTAKVSFIRQKLL